MNKYFIQINPAYYVPRQLYEYITWLVGNNEDKPMPHLPKRRMLKRFAREFKIPVLVETGTYLGEMVHAMRNQFSKIYSIELAKALAEKAQKRFSHQSSIQIIQGDSATILPGLAKSIDTPALFWLDGHYSGGETAIGEVETPIMKELGAIFENRNCKDVILIDDARLFVGKNDYPTIDEVKKYVSAKRPEMKFKVDKQIICIYP